MAVVCGLRPFGKTPRNLFAEIKAGKPGMLETGYLRRGRALEPLVCGLYEQAAGRAVIRPSEEDRMFYRWRDIVGVHIDGVVLPQDDEGHGVFEAKTMSEREFRKLEELGIPDKYTIQLQTSMFVAGMEWGSFCFFCPQAWEIYWVDQEIDLVLTMAMQEAAQEFHRFVENDTPPPPEFAMPADIAAKLADLHPEPVIVESLDEEALIDDYQYWDTELKTVQGKREAAMTGVEQVFREHDTEKLCAGEHELSWRKQSRKYIDHKLLKAEHPEIDWERYEQVSEFRVLRARWGESE